jgi:hypothetical protein
LNGGGFLLDVPERCIRDNRLTPSAEEVSPWIEQIRALIENEEIYQEAKIRAYQAATKFAPELAVQVAMELFTELLKQGKD